LSYSIKIEDLNFLLSHKGQEKLKDLSLLDLSPHNVISIIQHLRREFRQNEVAALVETALLRKRAEEKFTNSHRMYFTSDALEQSTGEIISRHRAKRFSNYTKVADLTCGIGGDLLGLAETVPHIIAGDRDEVRLNMAKANMEALGLSEKIEFHCADLRRPWPVDAVFLDPSRRSGGKRIFNLEGLEPPFSELMTLREHTPSMGIKIFPGINYEEIPAGCEVEFISHNGLCKEGVLWFGDLRKTLPTEFSFSRSVTILPEDIHIEEQEVDPVPSGEPLTYIYEPDPAIIRSHMVEWLAWELEARKLDNNIAYLTSDRFIKTPLARVWKIEKVMSFNLKKINRSIAEHHIGHIVIKKRGLPVEPEEFQKKLKSVKCGKEGTLFLTRCMGRKMAIICADLNCIYPINKL